MLQTVRSHLRRDHRWLRWRRIQKEGVFAAASRRRIWSKILAAPPVPKHLCAGAGNTEVHLLCWDADYLSAIWALKSLYRFVTQPLPLVVHFQGHLTARIERTLRSHLPGARLVAQSEADCAIEDVLNRRRMPRIAASRRQAPFMQKLVDFLILAHGQRILILDADVLFFAPPKELFRATQSAENIALFLQDPASVYNVSEEQAQSELGIEVAPRINTGIVVIDREIVDLGRCEYFLGNPDVARPNGYIEQTLYALVASERNCVSYLPQSYLVSLDHGKALTVS